ncbi:Sugar kinase of the NBD/HSP70 family, may contain an N-terminal HTH domain [Lachnospiraceae bacterium]|nr:Sugar kinase of the NBD/HSP70 family, may contain an N-terminal HTH domain [Lachnospiraceae bacterium]
MNNTNLENFDFNLKKFNTSNIYSYFLNHEAATKQDLASGLNLTLPTVTKNIAYLSERGLIQISGSRGQTGGRRAATYSLCAEAKVALGLDITRHHVACVAVDLNGKIISFSRNRLVFKFTDDYFKKVSVLLNNFIESHDIENDKILGVGIGIPALVQSDNCSVFYSSIIDIRENTYDMFRKYIPFDIAMFNDAKAACFAEKWVNKDILNSFYIMLSNNVGGSMIINGQVYSGDNFRSAEVGHITLVPHGRQCYCGQCGCVDPYLAATNLSQDDLAGYFENLKTTDDEKILDNWSQYLDYMVSTVNIVRTILDCDIILGGYVGAYLEPYLDEIKKRALKISTFDSDAEFIKLCSYKHESIAAGAALHYISEFIKTV